ncbi:DUF7685 domain-containing protein [Methylocapsa acidiphila]|uniref:DUF7685 domain-containing protein n=1 Tax=Methylocapsa acidiphila TaxID=133552 RepID=UPI003CC91F9B
MVAVPHSRSLDGHRFHFDAANSARRMPPTAVHDIVDFGSMVRGYKQLCSRCFNAEGANLSGLGKFEHVEFQQVALMDSVGNSHEFHFRIICMDRSRLWTPSSFATGLRRVINSR